MPGAYTVTTRTTGQVLTASIYNADHQNHIDHLEPQYIDDASTNLAAMQATTDPGELSSESLATTLAGEIARLRYAIQEIKAAQDPRITRWYETPYGQNVANVRTYGATGDGVTNDRTAIQACLDANLRVYFPPGSYLLSGANSQSADGLQLRTGHELFGSGWTSILLQNSNSQYIASVNQYAGGTTSVADNKTNIHIHDLMFKSNVATYGFSQHYHQLNLNAASDVVVERCKFHGFRGDGIYIGSGNQAAIERHNERVTIRDCTFDGSNNDNRNGISVIDCDTVTVHNCHFVDITRAGMPGAIDLEPDSTFNIVKNVNISHCEFLRIGGGATVGLYLADKTYTTLPTHITVEHCKFDACTSIFGFYVSNATAGGPLTSTKDYGIHLLNNHFRSLTRYCGAITGVKGVLVAGNIFEDCAETLFLGFTNGTMDTLRDAVVRDNISVRCGEAAFCIGYVTNLCLLDNTIQDAGTYAIYFIGTATSSYVTLKGNVLKNPGSTMTYAVVKAAGHTLDASTNIIVHNDWAGLEQATKAYLCDTTNQVEAFDTTTLPDSFPAGVSMAVINGETGAPDTAHQGILLTYRYTITNGYRKFQYQTYKAANNDQYSRSEFWYRNAASATNTWDTWQRGLGTTGGYPDYTATNVTADRSYDANATTTDELADVLGTLIADLINAHVIV